MSTTTETWSGWEAQKNWLQFHYSLYQGFEQPELPTDGKRPCKVMSLQSLEVIKQRVDNHNPVLQGGAGDHVRWASRLPDTVLPRGQPPLHPTVRHRRTHKSPNSTRWAAPSLALDTACHQCSNFQLPELQFSHPENKASNTSPPYFTEISQRNVN